MPAHPWAIIIPSNKVDKPMLRIPLVAAILAVLTASALAQTQTPDADIFGLAKSWILATEYVSEARDSVWTGTEKPASGGQAEPSLIDIMTANRRAVLKLASAAEQLPPPSRYKPKSTEHTAVEGYRTFVAVLKKDFDDAFAIYQRLITLKTDSDLAGLMASTAELSARTDEDWKLLIRVSVALTYAFVDSDRVTDGKLQHLRLTTNQRRELARTIQKQFPKAAKGLVSGQHAVEASMGADPDTKRRPSISGRTMIRRIAVVALVFLSNVSASQTPRLNDFANSAGRTRLARQGLYWRSGQHAPSLLAF